jgi:hypothetical protein
MSVYERYKFTFTMQISLHNVSCIESETIFSRISLNILKIKAKAVPLHVTKALGWEIRYSSYPFLTSALDGSEWSASHLGCASALGKGPPVPIVQEVASAPYLVWTQRLE